MNPLLAITLSAGGWAPLLALACLAVGMAFAHQGTLDVSALTDIVTSQCFGQTLALVAASVLPAGAITGAMDVVLINTGATPGNQTTRTAAQMYADLTAQLGFQPPSGFQWFLTIVHQGAGTLTLVAGTGVSLGTGTTSVATTGNRTYLCTLNSPTSITIQTTGSGSA